MEPNGVPLKQAALVGTSHKSLEITSEAPVPALKDGWVLIRNAAVGLNPIDGKMVGEYMTAGAIAGCDFAGTVVAIAPRNKPRYRADAPPLRVGDRVCAFVIGMNAAYPDIGAFAEYVATPEDHLVRVPPHASLEEVSTLGTCFMTALYAMRELDLPGQPLSPSPKPQYVLVYGGATATGTATCQLLRLSGLLPVATCSPHSFKLVESYGAVACFDYHEDEASITEIKKLTKGGLKYVFDCIGSVQSARFCYGALGRMGGRYESVHFLHEGITRTRKTVKPGHVFAPMLMGLDIGWPGPLKREASTPMGVLGAELAQILEDLLRDKKIRPHPIEIEDTGLDGIRQGIERLRANAVRGHKLVYTGICKKKDA